MESLFGDEWLLTSAPHRDTPARRSSRSAFDRTFPTRVAALLRSRPIGDLATAAARQDWPDDTYDIPGLALAAIELVIAQQGFEDEATYSDVVDGLVSLARTAAPERPAEEHTRSARYVVDGLLNRSQQEAPFTFRISDWSDEEAGHRQRQVQFRLLVEREDPIRGEVVLNATGDAINALVGGLEFEVEDEQVANEILLERQLARGAFDAAERAAARARLLSAALSDRLQTLIRATRRDLRTVLEEWATTVPAFLDGARGHIRGRLEVEHRLLVKVRETVVSDDPEVARASARIAAQLEESRRRHEALHAQVVRARTVFLEEQDRQAFRAPVAAYLPDLHTEVLLPLLNAPADTALQAGGRWLSDAAGPRPPRLPRLYRVINDLWSLREENAADQVTPTEDELAGHDEPLLRAVALETAARAVARTGLPARLSALIAACLDDPLTPSATDRQQAAEITALAVLWSFSPEETSDGERERADVTASLLGPRAAADTDGTPLVLPGWSGDDLVVAPFADSLMDADPPPVTRLAATPTEVA